jgi:hypothetical protein
MTRTKEIDRSDFIAITIADGLDEYPEPLRTAWLELSTNHLYVSAALADLKVLYQESKRLERTATEGLPIIEHGRDRYVDIAWLKKICPGQASHFTLLERIFRRGLFSQDRPDLYH